MQIADFLPLLEKLAPQGLAMNWDNVGLQVGLPGWQTGKILLTLDVTPRVVDYAVKCNYGLILSHHPLIFRPVSSVTRPEIVSLLQHQIAVIAMHSNLDVVPQGVNYALAETLNLKITGLLSSETGSNWYHASVTVPPLYAEKLMEAVHKAGAGRIGRYDKCSTKHNISGTYCPLEGSSPFHGSQGKCEKVDEIELEFMVDSFNLQAVKNAVASAHPYETPAVYFTEAQNSNPAYGLGLVCELPKPVELVALAEQIKKKLKAPYVRLWTAGKSEHTAIKTVAVCGGAGSSLINTAAGKADVLATGDINYHSMLESRIPLIDAGHFYTEYPVLGKLHKLLAEEGINTDIYPPKKHEINNNLLI